MSLSSFELSLLILECVNRSNVCKMAALGLGWSRSLGSDVKSWVELDNRVCHPCSRT